MALFGIAIVIAGCAVLKARAHRGPLISVQLVRHVYGTNGAMGMGITNNIYYFSITNKTGSWLWVRPKIDWKAANEWHEWENLGEFSFNLAPHSDAVVHQRKPFLGSWRVSFVVSVSPGKTLRQAEQFYSGCPLRCDLVSRWISQKVREEMRGVQCMYED